MPAHTTKNILLNQDLLLIQKAAAKGNTIKKYSPNTFGFSNVEYTRKLIVSNISTSCQTPLNLLGNIY